MITKQGNLELNDTMQNNLQGFDTRPRQLFMTRKARNDYNRLKKEKLQSINLPVVDIKDYFCERKFVLENCFDATEGRRRNSIICVNVDGWTFPIFCSSRNGFHNILRTIKNNSESQFEGSPSVEELMKNFDKTGIFISDKTTAKCEDCSNKPIKKEKMNYSEITGDYAENELFKIGKFSITKKVAAWTGVTIFGLIVLKIILSKKGSKQNIIGLG